MNDTQRNLLIRWLNDAYSMEVAIAEVLEKHKSQAEGNEVVHEKIEKHLYDTEKQADRIKECIESLNGDISTIKPILSNLIGMVQGMSSAPSEDKLIKNALTEYAIEHFEIASYKALIAVSNSLGQDNVVSVCREILGKEEEMAQWLLEHLEEVVQGELQKKED